MVKSYKQSIPLNIGKQDYIEKVLLPEWRRVSKKLVDLHLTYFYKNNCVCLDNKLYQKVDSFLTERYKDCINRQVKGIILSMVKNAKIRYLKLVLRSNLSEDIKKDLCLVNKRNLFFVNEDLKGKNHLIDTETIKLGRKLFKYVLGRKSSTKNINMKLQDKIAVIEVSNSKEFKYYIKLSSGDKRIKGKFMYIPVKENKYFENVEGKLSTSCELQFKNNKLKNVIFFKEIEDKSVKPLETNDMVISFDIGLNILFALNNGECYGKHYLKRLKKLDTKLIKLQNGLKEKHGKHVKLTKFDEYNKLVQTIKDYSKNEINRLLNKIVDRHKPYKIVLEDLDFKGSKLSKTTNRLLSRFGLKLINDKLEQINQEKGIEIIYTDAAYTSQTCSNCKYVDKRNRKTHKEFECLCCGKKINADVNGGKTIEYFNERFGEKRFYSKSDRNMKRTLLVQDFLNLKVWKGDERITNILKLNPYFKDFI